uniref:Immunoglobulin V-set domain-containing protein n=1 Tax=Lates calcarifer TaxID=8187 RepID=A0A4W6EEK0_LATCA
MHHVFRNKSDKDLSKRLYSLMLFAHVFQMWRLSAVQPTIHKEVGDTQLGNMENNIVADKDQSVIERPQFKDRLFLNPTNYSLTVRGLTLQDSGEFSFVSEVNEEQRPTVTVTLQVHVLLECTVTSDSGVTYKWAYILRPQDGETTFTCTVFSFLKEKSVSKGVKCSNETYEPRNTGMWREVNVALMIVCVCVVGNTVTTGVRAKLLSLKLRTN